MLRSARRQVTDLQIRQLFRKSPFPEKANRIAQRKISSWISKFDGEIIGIDVSMPSAAIALITSGKGSRRF